jgi:hypothetical protein
MCIASNRLNWDWDWLREVESCDKVWSSNRFIGYNNYHKYNDDKCNASNQSIH